MKESSQTEVMLCHRALMQNFDVKRVPNFQVLLQLKLQKCFNELQK